MMTAISETLSESDKRIDQAAITDAREPDWCGTITHLHMVLSAMREATKVRSTN
jgi:hypothetical protein